MIDLIFKNFNNELEEIAVEGYDDDRQYLYVVRQGKEIVALFPHEQGAVYYCQNQLENLHYQKELWRKVIL